MPTRTFWLVILALFQALGAQGHLVAQEPGYNTELTAILSDGRVQEAMAVIAALEPTTARDLIDLTQIPAPPFLETERARAYADLLRGAGADSVRMDAVGNVLAFKAGLGGGRTVVLGAHLDTVFPEGTDVTVRVRGDTLFAPGIGDDTRGLLVVLTVLRAMDRTGLESEANLIFLGSVGEEGLGDLRGVKHLFRDGGPRVDAFIEVDGGGLAGIVSMGLGSVRYRATVRGRRRGASGPEPGGWLERRPPYPGRCCPSGPLLLRTPIRPPPGG